MLLSNYYRNIRSFSIAIDRNINAQTRNQRDPLNLVKNRTNLEIRINFFCERVVDTWNHIPSEIKQSENVKIFKRSLVRWMKMENN